MGCVIPAQWATLSVGRHGSYLGRMRSDLLTGVLCSYPHPNVRESLILKSSASPEQPILPEVVVFPAQLFMEFMREIGRSHLSPRTTE